MVKVSGVAVLVLLVVGLLASCAPAASSSATEDTAAPRVLESSGTVLHGMPVRYMVMDKVIYQGEHVAWRGNRVAVWSNWTGKACEVQISESARNDLMRDPGFGRMLAGHVAYCFNFGPLGRKYVDDVGEEGPLASAYDDAYADAYVAKCGNKLEPLGWFGAHDGKCELPDPASVTL